MFRSYLTISLRNLLRQKGYSLIKIAGLALGLACCMLISLWVLNETGYDRHFPGADRIYRITYAERIGGVYDHYAMSPFPAAPAFTAGIPGISAHARLWRQTGLIKADGRKFEEENIYYTDPGFMKIFQPVFLDGDPDRALVSPGSVVITESIARKLFGTEKAAGRRVYMSHDGDLQVTGVVRDFPAATHFEFRYLISMNTLQGRRAEYLNNWQVICGWSYLRLDGNADPAEVARKMEAVAKIHSGRQANQQGTEFFYYLQPLKDIHLHSALQAEIRPNGDIHDVYLFSAIALFILVIAGINFMNLSIARSACRGKEIGIRKVLGARPANIKVQFICDAVCQSALSLILALILLAALSPLFSQATGQEFNPDGSRNGWIWFGFLVLALLTGILAGIYPARVMARSRPAGILRSSRPRSRWGLRNILVTLQFAISLFLIICTFTVLRQVQFLKNSHPGFRREQVLVLQVKGTGFRQNFEVFRQELLKNPRIMSAAYSDGIPGRVSTTLTTYQAGKPLTVTHTFNYIFAGPDFLQTYGLELDHGRFFSPELKSDEGAFLINETARRKLGSGTGIIGQNIGFDENNLTPVLGIVRDFHYRSLKETIGPLAICLSREAQPLLSLRLAPGDPSRTLDFITSTWRKFETDRSLSWFFAGDHFASQYASEDRLSFLITCFAGLSIFIACLGLLGLAAHTAGQRTREIGIRKVLGSTVSQIAGLLSGEFARWVLLANVIAWPLAWLATRMWLQGFAYHTIPGAGLYLGASLLILVLAGLTISFQTIRAARANPVESLKHE